MQEPLYLVQGIVVGRFLYLFTSGGWLEAGPGLGLRPDTEAGVREGPWPRPGLRSSDPRSQCGDICSVLRKCKYSVQMYIIIHYYSTKCTDPNPTTLLKDRIVDLKLDEVV